MDQIKITEEGYVIFTKSYIDAEDFKYNTERKKAVIKKTNFPYCMPIVVYVKNENIPDLKKSVYIVNIGLTIDELLVTLRKNMVQDIPDLKLKLSNEGEDDDCLVGDINMLELHEEFRNKGDGFLYLILDEYKEKTIKELDFKYTDEYTESIL
jgi:hypothetical protein